MEAKGEKHELDILAISDARLPTYQTISCRPRRYSKYDTTFYIILVINKTYRVGFVGGKVGFGDGSLCCFAIRD
jgi:hypothetical protein